QLFHNQGDGKGFRENSNIAGPAFSLAEVSRGAAFGDIDNDGAIDLIVTNNNGPARLLRNQMGSRNHWLEVKLEAPKTNRFGIGARVTVLRREEKPLWGWAHTGSSYLSASDVRVHFGLGENAQLEGVVVQWPG